MQTPNTIILRTSTPVLRKEGVAAGNILPGHLIAGPDSALVVHGAAGQNARKAFAVEYDPAKGIDDAYVTGDQVMYGIFKPGEEVYALVAAGAAAIAEGDALESAGDGTLRKQVTSAATAENARDSVVGYAREAVDNSGGADVARIRVEVA